MSLYRGILGHYTEVAQTIYHRQLVVTVLSAALLPPLSQVNLIINKKVS